MKLKKILVVDDEPDIAETLKLLLEIEGYEVIKALDGKEAIDKACSVNPDLIVLDVMLPVVDGYEVFSRLKSKKQFEQTPVVILTACAQKADEKLWEESGADFYMVKPFDFDRLSDKIRELLSVSENS